MHLESFFASAPPSRSMLAGRRPRSLARTAMFASYHLFRLFGTNVSINSSLFYMALFHFTVVVNGHADLGGLDYAFPLYVCAFASILVHEYGHAFAARLRGIGCSEITLSAIGGLATLDRTPERPLDEFLIAVAGPVTSVVLAAVIACVFWIPMPEYLHRFLVELFVINVVIAVFNMVPAYPMDGGRVLHALLTAAVPRFWADRISVAIGQLLAVAFMALGCYVMSPVLVLVGVFVFAFAAIGLGHRVFWFLGARPSSLPARKDDGRQA